MYYRTVISLIVLAAFQAVPAFAAPVTWGGPTGMSVLSNPNAMSVINSSVLAPQSDEENRAASARSSAINSAANASLSSSPDYTAQIITQEVESSIASQISQSITGQNGAPDSGSYTLGNGQSITYDRSGGNTNVSILNPGQSPINISFPTIQ